MSGENNRSKGDKGENATAEFLESNGYQILERNYTRRGGEIDIIAYKNEQLVFVEVKTRREGARVSGMQAVNMAKRMRIIRTAEIYSREFEKLHGQTSGRFDIACIEVDQNGKMHMKYSVAAFDAHGS